MKKIVLLYGLILAFIFGSALTAQAFEPFKFAVISDSHLSVATSDSPQNDTKMFKNSVELLEAAIQAINAQPDIDYVVALGDLTKDAEPWNLDRFKELMDELTMPWYVVLGNHDLCPTDTYARKQNPGVSRATMIWTFQGHGFTGTDEHWSLDPQPGVHLIGLDTNIINDWGGRVNRRGLNFLKSDLAANPGKLTIVMLHSLLLPYTQAEETKANDFHKFITENAADIRGILEQAPQVALTLSGHRHLSTRYKMGAHIAYFTFPSTMTWPMRYAIVAVDQTQISYQTYDVPCDPEIWEEARQNILTLWPRDAETPKTPEGDQRLEEIMLSENTKSGTIPLNPKTITAVSK